MSEIIDNRTERVNVLKGIIKHLHEGKPADEVRSELRRLVKQTDYSEIMAMEQQLISEGMPVEEVRSMCDLHSQVTRDVLVQLPAQNTVPPGHPIDTFRRENEALKGVLTEMRACMSAVDKCAGKVSAHLLPVRQAWNDLMDVEKHYQRKEHALFSCLERHGITGPSKVMWAKDDDIRALLKQLGAALQQIIDTSEQWNAGPAKLADAAVAAVQEMIYKEENILLPMAQRTLTDSEWAEIWHASPKYGWCLVEPREGYKPNAEAQKNAGDVHAGSIMLPTGNVSVEQLTAVLSTLPLDLTFVDADDRVAFFTEGPQRIFPRSKAIIGRKVQNCHPPRSVAVVDRILEDFRAGRQDVAEFWIDFHGKFVHIRYFAVRDEQGQYLGTLELTQDIAPVQKLKGEKRLLDHNEPAAS